MRNESNKTYGTEGAANGGKDGGSYRPTTTLSLGRARRRSPGRRSGRGRSVASREGEGRGAGGGRKEERGGERRGESKGEEINRGGPRDETGKATVHHPNQPPLSLSPRLFLLFLFSHSSFCFFLLLSPCFFPFLISLPHVFMILGLIF